MARRGGTPENLKRYPKGETGNPNGRPPVLPELKEAIAKIFNEEKDGVTALEAALRSLRAKATKGDLKAIEILLDRGYGKPHQSVSASVRTEVIVIDMENVDNADQG